MSRRCDWFLLQELVPKCEFEIMGGLAWNLIDPDILIIIDAIRDKSGSAVTINNWDRGGTFQYRGWRPLNCPYGAPKSMHKKGKAIDCDIKGKTADESRQWIRDNHHRPGIKLIRRIELDVNWLHIDTFPTGASKLIEIPIPRPSVQKTKGGER